MAAFVCPHSFTSSPSLSFPKFSVGALLRTGEHRQGSLQSVCVLTSLGPLRLHFSQARLLYPDHLPSSFVVFEVPRLHPLSLRCHLKTLNPSHHTAGNLAMAFSLSSRPNFVYILKGLLTSSSKGKYIELIDMENFLAVFL